jgi:hypothetical protein
MLFREGLVTRKVFGHLGERPQLGERGFFSPAVPRHSSLQHKNSYVIPELLT